MGKADEVGNSIEEVKLDICEGLEDAMEEFPKKRQCIVSFLVAWVEFRCNSVSEFGDA